jgi:hypothetical protein
MQYDQKPRDPAIVTFARPWTGFGASHSPVLAKCNNCAALQGFRHHVLKLPRRPT